MVTETVPSRQFSTPVVLASCFLTGAAGILLYSFPDTEPLREHIRLQLTFVSLLFGLSSLGLLAVSQAFRMPFFLVKIFFLYFIASAAGPVLPAFMCLLTSCIFELFFFNDFRTASILSGILFGVLFFSVSGSTSWNVIQPGITAGETAVLLLVSAAAVLTATVCSRAVRSNRQNEGEIRRLEDAVTNLTKTNTAYQTYATYIEETSKDEERHRISREIHDIVGYSMTNLLMIVQAALYSENQDQVTELLQKAQTHINDSLLEVRMALRKLRSTQKRTLHGSSLIRYLTDNFQKVTGIRVKLDFISFPLKINPEIEEILYRMLQEAMTNSFRHGRAGEIQISFWTGGEYLIVQIRDNGKTHNVTQIVEGIGIQGMRERIAEIGGSFTLDSVSDGFTVLARLPLEKRTKT